MEETKSCIVFGATGNTGISVMRKAIKEGLNVTAFARKPERIPDEIRKKVKVVVGDVLDDKAVEQAVVGKDMVFSALGTGWSMGDRNLISQGCLNIVNGMKKHKVKRLSVVSTDFLFEGHWKPWFMKGLIEDHRRQLQLLEREKDSIDWVAMMPPMIRPSDCVNQNYMIQKNERKESSSVTTAEIADFMVNSLTSNIDEYRHVKVGISSGPALSIPTGAIVLASVSAAALGVFAAYHYGLIKTRP